MANLLSLPGSVFVRVRVSQDVFSGQSSSANVRRDFSDLKKKAKQNALYEAVLMGKKLSIIHDDEVKNFGNQSEPYESVLKFMASDKMKDNVEVLETKVNYVGTSRKKKPPKYIQSKVKQDKKGKPLIKVRRENWKGKYVKVARKQNGRIVSWSKWSSKPSE